MSVATKLFEEFADRLPSDPADQRRVLELGLRELSIRRALEAFGRGEGSLAYAARQAGVPLRQMIPLAYAHGLEPAFDPDLAEPAELSLDRAAEL
jgi:hypothetical protein